MNWKVFSILFFVLFSTMLGQGLVVPLLPAYAHELGGSGLYIGFIFGAFSFSRTLFLPYFGRLSDTKGRKPFITSGIFAYFLVSIAYLFVTDVNTLIFVRFLQGIAAAMIFPVAQAYTGEITPRNKEGFIMGLLNVSLYGGLSTGPIFGGVIKDYFGIHASFLSMGLVCIIGFLISLLFLPPRNQERVSARTRPLVGYRELLRDRHIVGLFLFRFAFTMCMGTVWSFVPLFADIEFRLSSMDIGILITLSVLVGAILMAPMGFLADRINKRFLIGAGGLLTVCSMIFLSIIHEPWELYATTILIGIGGGISMPSIMAMAVVIGRKNDSMGSIISLLTMAHSLAMLAGPVIAGAMMDMLEMRVAFIGGAIIMFFATCLTLPLISGFETSVIKKKYIS